MIANSAYKLLITITVTLLFLLLLRFYLFYKDQVKFNDNQQITFETNLFSEPQVLSKTQRFWVEEKGQRIFIITPLFPQYHYGDKLQISGNLKINLLKDEKTFISMIFPKVEAKNPSAKDLLGEGLAITSFVRQKIMSFFQSTLAQTHSSLLLGIVFGVKSGMPSDFFEYLRISGVLHVVAASGMNVTMTGGFLSSIFVLFLRRQIAIILTIIGIIFYAFLAGLEPSIIRASIMGILVFTAQILGRQAWALLSLLIAGFLMLFISPSLLFDIGFQLSFLATLGLIYIKMPFKINAVTEGLSTTVSAQLATLPILLVNFGTYSLWSVLTNGLVLWTVPYLMVLGGLGALISLIFEPLARIFLYLSLPLLLYFEKVVSFFANLGGLISIDGLNWIAIIGYYILLLALVLLRKQQVQ